jgi:hypothetical protein
MDDHVLSWVKSSNYPTEALEVEEVGCDGSMEEGKEVASVDQQPCQQLLHGELSHGDGEMSLVKEGNSCTHVSMSVNIMENKECNNSQIVLQPVGFVGDVDEECGSLGEKVSKGDSCWEQSTAVQKVMVTCPVDGKVISNGGPDDEQLANGVINASNPCVLMARVNPVGRSYSLPPNLSRGPGVVLGQFNDFGPQTIHSISLL